MKPSILVVWSIMVFIVGCHYFESKKNEPKIDNAEIPGIGAISDTTKLIKLAIETAFYRENLPGLSDLRKKQFSKDSILFTSESLPLTLLPMSIDSLKFKIISR